MGQVERKGCPAGGAAHLDGSPQLLHYLFHQGQAQPRAPFLPGILAGNAVKALKDARQLLGRDLLAVADLDAALRIFRFNLQADGSLGRRVFHGIVQKLAQDPAQQQGIRREAAF